MAISFIFLLASCTIKRDYNIEHFDAFFVARVLAHKRFVVVTLFPLQRFHRAEVEGAALAAGDFPFLWIYNTESRVGRGYTIHRKKAKIKSIKHTSKEMSLLNGKNNAEMFVDYFTSVADIKSGALDILDANDYFAAIEA